MIPEWAHQLRAHHRTQGWGELVGFVGFDAYVIRQFGERDFKARLSEMVEQLVGHREGVSVLPSYHSDTDEWKFTVFAAKVPQIEENPELWVADQGKPVTLAYNS